MSWLVQVLEVSRSTLLKIREGNLSSGQSRE